ncbi:MAG TPA: DUF1080 domain-containing protein [Ferrovibrio sp.]|uniref:3-keto-disaccharide hydrolase n=1 Tax=Ferrovibrio sp. TaxID=1917215 RepID=UPI002ED040C7
MSEAVTQRLFHLQDWRQAGPGGFRALGNGVVESFGGSGIYWYAAETYADFKLLIEWRVQQPTDNSGVFLRIPPLERDPRPAIEQGYEIQIDERGIDPAERRADDPLHLTGAVYNLAPAIARASRPVGEWNDFTITALGQRLVVLQNNIEVCRLDHGGRREQGHIGLQNHHDGSAVQFRNLEITPL